MTWQRVLRVGGTMLLAGLSAFGAATLVVGVDLGFEAAIMAGIAAFFANVFMIDGLARDKVAIVAATMNARCEPSSRTRPRPPTTRSRRWTWARHRTVCWAASKIEAANTRGQDGGLKSRFHVATPDWQGVTGLHGLLVGGLTVDPNQSLARTDRASAIVLAAHP
jgi:hypothetical protein